MNASSLHKSDAYTSRHTSTCTQELVKKEKHQLHPVSNMVGPFVGEIAVVDFVEFLPKVSNSETPIIDFSRVSKSGGKEEISGPFVREKFYSIVHPSFTLLII